MPPRTTASDPILSSLRCKICSKTLSSFLTLRRHERLMHGDRRILDLKTCARRKYLDDGTIPMDSPLRCTVCQKVFNSASKRRRHELTIYAGVSKTTAAG